MIIFLKEKTNQVLFKKDLSWGDFCQFTCTAILVPIQFSKNFSIWQLNPRSLIKGLDGVGDGGRFRKERSYVYLWLIHIDVWQKPTQHCKAIILQLKIKFLKSLINNNFISKG